MLTEDYRPVSERLVFAFNDDQMDVSVQPDKQTYSKREKVHVDISAIRQSLSEQTPTDSLSGNFAVSVIDDNDVQTDGEASNILSSVLLTSDLRGYVHNPAYYIEKSDKKVDLAADMLMMTQGWTRYDIPKALRGDFQYPEILPEKSQVISGMVKNGLLSKPYAGAKLTLVSSSSSFFEMGEADENGKFSYAMELPDSTAYLIKALNRKDEKSMIELFVNDPVYPDLNPKLNVLTAKDSLREENLQDYVAKADAKYVQENGIRTIALPEVVVKAEKKEDKYKSPYSSMFSYRITEDELEKMHAVNIQKILNNLPGVWATENSLTVHNTVPLVLIDDVPANLNMSDSETMKMLKEINVYDIGQVEYTRGAQAVIFGPEGSSGIIEIFTKRGEFTPVQKPNLNIKKLLPLGYQQPVEFYSPKYDTPESKENKTPDLRSVIYWKPDVVIDSAGKASFEFYMADSSSAYTVVIEGITDEGELIYHKAEGVISVK